MKDMATIHVAPDGRVSLELNPRHVGNLPQKALDPASLLALIEAIIQIVNLLKGLFGKSSVEGEESVEEPTV